MKPLPSPLDARPGSTLAAWLAPTTLGEFARGHLGRRPFARPDAAASTAGAFPWDALGRVLGSPDEPDVLVVRKGSALDLPPPRTLDDARALMTRGAGLVVRRAERQDAALAALADDLARDLPGETHVQLFVTPAGTHGFGWHYDFEEVFIVQTAGVKDYYFRANTVDRATPVGAQPDFGAVRRETSPLGTVRLVAGDWLYLPARWWHVAKCVEDSLSISLGVLPDQGGAIASTRLASSDGVV